MLSKARQFQADKELMDKVARELIAERRRDPKGNEKNDLLNLMLNGVDPVTGEKLSDENIGYQMITFLIAGHETTSGLLSFATYLLLKNPDVLQKARSIVDEVLGEEVPRVEHLAQLRYIEQILMEALRIWPTASVFSVSPHKDTVLAGKYPLTTRDIVMVLEPMLHRDPKVWGDDVEAFRSNFLAQIDRAFGSRAGHVEAWRAALDQVFDQALASAEVKEADAEARPPRGQRTSLGLRARGAGAGQLPGGPQRSGIRPGGPPRAGRDPAAADRHRPARRGLARSPHHLDCGAMT